MRLALTLPGEQHESFELLSSVFLLSQGKNPMIWKKKLISLVTSHFRRAHDYLAPPHDDTSSPSFKTEDF
jgi:hypothetical protein